MSNRRCVIIFPPKMFFLDIKKFISVALVLHYSSSYFFFWVCLFFHSCNYLLTKDFRKQVKQLLV